MAEVLKENEMLVCVGQTALRAPDGAFLPAVPLYVKVDKSHVDKKTGLSEGEAELQTDISGLLARKFAQYIEGIENAGFKE